jgi:hypothetical protein
MGLVSIQTIQLIHLPASFQLEKTYLVYSNIELTTDCQAGENDWIITKLIELMSGKGYSPDNSAYEDSFKTEI